MGIVKVNWTDFKNTYNTFETPMSSLESTDSYDIWMYVNGREYNTIIPKTIPVNSDQTDFETNYKTSVANTKNIWTSAQTTTAGELIVAQPPPSAPPNTTAVTQQYFSSISTTQEDFYTITSGKTLVIQRFRAACGEANDVTNVYLYDDVNGDLSVLNLIEIIFLNGGQFAYNLDFEIPGDGTRRVLVRRDPLGGGARLAFAKWEGFEKS
jgi:hypothetical protein